MNRRHSEASQRFAERRKREDEAPRLSAEFPKLESLRLEIEERRSGSPVGEAGYIRRIMVDHAPALFVLPCGDPSCKDGGHEITDGLLRALRGGQGRFETEDPCRGQIGSSECQRVLHCIAIATYRA